VARSDETCPHGLRYVECDDQACDAQHTACEHDVPYAREEECEACQADQREFLTSIAGACSPSGDAIEGARAMVAEFAARDRRTAADAYELHLEECQSCSDPLWPTPCDAINRILERFRRAREAHVRAEIALREHRRRGMCHACGNAPAVVDLGFGSLRWRRCVSCSHRLARSLSRPTSWQWMTTVIVPSRGTPLVREWIESLSKIEVPRG
jgi:hypothetical protein